MKFQRKLREYAAAFGYTDDRTIKNWLRVGKDNGDIPPLDSPELMPDWWTRNHRGRPLPQNLRGLSQLELAPVAPLPPVASVPAPADVLPLLAGDSFPEQVAALRVELNRSRRELESIAAEVCPKDEKDAIAWARGRSSRLEIAQRNFKGTFDILRKAENDLVEWQAKNALLVPKAEVASEFTRIVGAFYSAVKRLTKKLRPQLQGLPDAAADNVWQNGVRECFESLQRSDFSVDETLFRA